MKENSEKLHREDARVDTLILCLLFVSACVVPIAMMFGGWIMRSAAPAEPNRFVGYRTQLSMSSTDAWHYANSCCGRLWMRLGIVLLAGGMAAIFFVVLAILQNSVSVQTAPDALMWCILLVSGVQIACMILSIFLVERELRRVFHKDGSRRETAGH